MVKYGIEPERLTRIFSALADSTRRAILSRLTEGDASVSDLAAPFDVSLPAISKHLRVLEGAELLERTKEGRVHRIQLQPGPLAEASEWLEHYREFWERQLDALQDYLETTAPKARRSRRKGKHR